MTESRYEKSPDESAAYYQALYLGAIYAKAKKIYEASPNNFPIDTQNRVIIDVELTDEDLGILKTTLNQKLGHPITERTLVSYDLQDAKKIKLSISSEKSKDILDKYNQIPKARIISLQQEAYFHAHLIGRMVEKAYNEARTKNKSLQEIEQKKFAAGVDQALLDINVKVNELLGQALEKSYEKANKKKPFLDEIFQKNLNRELDKARKTILPMIAQKVRSEIIKSTGIVFNKNITQHLTKTLAKQTSASPCDVVHINKGSGCISYIGASEHTSHHRELGAENVADRMIYSHRLEKVLVYASYDRKTIRVPSLALKNAHDENEIIDDASKKIAHLQEKYNLGGDVKESPNTKAFVYNLLTSINRYYNPLESIDESTNKQTTSAIHILKAAHKYNKEAISAKKPICLVQNIPVNGWGAAVKINNSFFTPEVVNEAALMAQLALLHTVFDTLSLESQANANKIFNQYNTFLKNLTETDIGFFYTYCANQQPGDDKNVIDLLDKIKQDTKTSIENDELSPQQETFMSKTKSALADFFKTDVFSDLEYGFTVQALSIFTEESSLCGCKSASERLQAVLGRVAVLDFISYGAEKRNDLLNEFLTKDKDKDNNQSLNHIKQLATRLEDAIKNKNKSGIKSNMDKLYEAFQLEGCQALISYIDQGGHAKLATKGSSLLPSTNNAEDVHTDVKNASKWQCHKGLIDNVQSEFCGIKKFNLLKEISSAWLPVAALAGAGAATYFIVATSIVTIIFPPAGLIILAGAGVAIAAYLAVKVIPKWVDSWEIYAGKRFDGILQDNNKTVCEQEQAQAQAQAQAQQLTDWQGCVHKDLHLETIKEEEAEEEKEEAAAEEETEGCRSFHH